MKQFDAVIVQAAGNALVAVQILRQVQRILHRFWLFRRKHRSIFQKFAVLRIHPPKHFCQFVIVLDAGIPGCRDQIAEIW